MPVLKRCPSEVFHYGTAFPNWYSRMGIPHSGPHAIP
jgi:hypothetical protein